MSGDAAKIEPIRIDEKALAEIYAHAREAFPNECCGWITGAKDQHIADGVRRCVNAQDAQDAQGGDSNVSIEGRTAETAYVIDGADLIALSKSIDSEIPARIIYHSHPNGRAYFSETDRVVATSPWGDGPAYLVQHLVVGIEAERVVEAALFAWSDDDSGFVEVGRWTIETPVG